MKCRECPYSMACMSGRLDRGFVMMGLCPECARFYGMVDREAAEKEVERRREEPLNKRIEEAKKHGIDLDYERHAQMEFQQEYLGVFIPTPRTTVVMFRCELRYVTRAIRRKWRDTSIEVRGMYRYTTGWAMPDPAELMSEPLNIRACPECCRWPDYHIIEDLDEKACYEAEKERATPAFRLKGRSTKGR